MKLIRIIGLVIGLLVLSFAFFLPSKVYAQMMNGTGSSMMGQFVTPTITPTQQDLQDIQTGKDLLTKLQNNQITCSSLKDDDLEKIGEYLMDQGFGGNTNAHLQMNNAMKQTMGEQGEEQMHIRLAANVTGCNTTTQGGGRVMMGNWGWAGTGLMMGGNWFGAFGVFALIFWTVAFIDLILLGVFLWRKIRK